MKSFEHGNATWKQSTSFPNFNIKKLLPFVRTIRKRFSTNFLRKYSASSCTSDLPISVLPSCYILSFCPYVTTKKKKKKYAPHSSRPIITDKTVIALIIQFSRSLQGVTDIHCSGYITWCGAFYQLTLWVDKFIQRPLGIPAGCSDRVLSYPKLQFTHPLSLTSLSLTHYCTTERTIATHTLPWRKIQLLLLLGYLKHYKSYTFF